MAYKDNLNVSTQYKILTNFYAMESKCNVEYCLPIGIIGGSGLDDPDILENQTNKCVSTPFGNPSDVLVLGTIAGNNCVLLARHGRKHSIMPGKINYRANIWALKQEGCTHVIATTATGSLVEEYKPGDLVIMDSFIDRTQGRKQSFYDGDPKSPPGVCHMPMEPAFCNKTRALIIERAKELGFPYHDTGVCVSIEGPRFSSRAESKMYGMWGGSVINMTTVPEVVLAREAGLLYASIALVTDYCCWRVSENSVCVQDVVETFAKNVDKVTKIISTVIPKIAEIDWTTDVENMKTTVESSFQG